MIDPCHTAQHEFQSRRESLISSPFMQIKGENLVDLWKIGAH